MASPVAWGGLEDRPLIAPGLTVRGADRAIAFYRAAFGAEERRRESAPWGGTVLLAEVRIGGALLYLGDEFPDIGVFSPETLGGSPVAIHLLVDDVNAVFDRAIAAGATASVPPVELSLGDRFARLVDPFGHSWALSDRAWNTDTASDSITDTDGDTDGDGDRDFGRTDPGSAPAPPDGSMPS